MLNWTNDETSIKIFETVFKLVSENPKVLEIGTFTGPHTKKLTWFNWDSY
jgi:hypothetical protein